MGKREIAYKYQLVFKGEPLELEEVRVKLLNLGYYGVPAEKVTGQNHLEAYVGNWFFQFYGTGTINVFVKSREAAFEVSKFLTQLGCWWELDKIIPRPALLLDVFEKSKEGKISKFYPMIFKIIKIFEYVLVKCLIDAFKSMNSK